MNRANASVAAIAVAALVILNVAAGTFFPSYREALRSARVRIVGGSGTTAPSPTIAHSPVATGTASTGSVSVNEYGTVSDGSGTPDVQGSTVLTDVATVPVPPKESRDVPETTSRDGNANTGSVTGSGASGTTARATGATDEIALPEAFLLRLVPEFSLEKAGKSGIFGITPRSELAYTTYRDTQRKLTAIAIHAPFDAFVADLTDRAHGLYSTKATSLFYGATTYFNRTPSDDVIRFVFETDGVLVAVEIPSARYAQLKKLLLHE